MRTAEQLRAQAAIEREFSARLRNLAEGLRAAETDDPPGWIETVAMATDWSAVLLEREAGASEVTG